MQARPVAGSNDNGSPSACKIILCMYSRDPNNCGVSCTTCFLQSNRRLPVIEKHLSPPRDNNAPPEIYPPTPNKTPPGREAPFLPSSSRIISARRAEPFSDSN